LRGAASTVVAHEIDALEPEEAIIAAKGDYDSKYMGEFYDQKYGWEDLGEVSAEDIASLKRLKILSE
jgi:hypothetical protein